MAQIHIGLFPFCFKLLENAHPRLTNGYGLWTETSDIWQVTDILQEILGQEIFWPRDYGKGAEHLQWNPQQGHILWKMDKGTKKDWLVYGQCKCLFPASHPFVSICLALFFPTWSMNLSNKHLLTWQHNILSFVWDIDVMIFRVIRRD